MTPSDRRDVAKIRHALTGAPAGPDRIAAVDALARIEERLRLALRASLQRSEDDTRETAVPR